MARNAEGRRAEEASGYFSDPILTPLGQATLANVSGEQLAGQRIWYGKIRR
jgi:hypothetical protein